MTTRRNKLSAQPVMTPAGRFASKGEYRRYCQLQQLEMAGEISDLTRQPKYPLFVGGRPVLIKSEGYPNGRQAVYTADFKYVENGVPVTEDFKGFADTASRLRMAVAEAVYGITIRVTGAASYKRKKRSA